MIFIFKFIFITGHTISVSNQELFPLFQENQENMEEPIAAIARDWNQKNRPQGPILIKQHVT